MGGSMGGLKALRAVLEALPAEFPLAILIVLHSTACSSGLLAEVLAPHCKFKLAEAEDKQPIRRGHIYVAPPDYHLLVEQQRHLALSIDPKVCNVRPAMDVLFKTAAQAYAEHLIAVVLTGANKDGAEGLLAVRSAGGIGIVQDPETAEADAMPRAAIAVAGADHVLALERIAPMLQTLTE